MKEQFGSSAATNQPKPRRKTEKGIVGAICLAGLLGGGACTGVQRPEVHTGPVSVEMPLSNAEAARLRANRAEWERQEAAWREEATEQAMVNRVGANTPDSYVADNSALDHYVEAHRFRDLVGGIVISYGEQEGQQLRVESSPLESAPSSDIVGIVERAREEGQNLEIVASHVEVGLFNAPGRSRVRSGDQLTAYEGRWELRAYRTDSVTPRSTDDPPDRSVIFVNRDVSSPSYAWLALLPDADHLQQASGHAEAERQVFGWVDARPSQIPARFSRRIFHCTFENPEIVIGGARDELYGVPGAQHATGRAVSLGVSEEDHSQLVSRDLEMNSL